MTTPNPTQGPVAPEPVKPEPVTPQLRQEAIFPPGIVPRRAQAWVIGGIALVMVLVIAFSGDHTSGKPTDPARSLPVHAPPDQSRIMELRQRIEEQARKLRTEQAEMMRAKQAAGLSGELPDGLDTSERIGRERLRHSDRSVRYDERYGSRGDPYAPSPEKSWAQQDLEKRNHLSLFASNMALSLREAPKEELASSPSEASSVATALKGKLPPAADKKQEPAVVADPPVKTYRISEGTVIEGTLVNRLDGDFSGPVLCQVTTDVYSRDRQHLVIPAGTRVLGTAQQVSATGQRRLAVGFHRLVMPNDKAVSLQEALGLNQIGETGLRDRVNNHYVQIFGVSLAIGAFAGLSQANTRYGLDASALDVYRQGAATSVSQSSLRILDRFLNILPTHTILEGHRIKIFLAGDVDLPAYDSQEEGS